MLIKENTVVFWNLENTYKTFSKDLIENVLDQAFKSWEKYINLSFQKTSDLSKNPIIKIGFFKKDHVCDEKFDGKSGILAHATFPIYTSKLFIHFDSDENWCFDEKMLSCKLSIKFYNIALHEIGHILGLTHSQCVKSIMHEKYNRFKNSLSNKDVISVQKLYGKKIEAPKDDFLLLYYMKIYNDEFLLGLGFFLLIFTIIKS